MDVFDTEPAALAGPGALPEPGALSEPAALEAAQDAAQQPSGPAVVFAFDPETGAVRVTYDPAAGQAPSQISLKDGLRDAGLDHYAINEPGLAVFAAECRAAKQVVSAVVGGTTDAELQLMVADDLMEATLTIVPAQGGKKVTMVQLNAALQEKGITNGILHLELEAALAAGACDSVVVARGEPPSEGIPARFESMLEAKRRQLHEVDENALVKYSDLSHLLLVDPGDPLMRRWPPVQGSNGIDIKGQVAFAKPVEEMAFGDQFRGAAPDPDNPNLLRATIPGQPVEYDNGVAVNPVIEVAGVNLGVGNINFDGTIHVSGDVISGMTVKVTGDVFIDGTLEAALIEAGGNVVVKGGVIGHADNKAGSKRLPLDTARIICKGSLSAVFMENAHVEAGDSIMIEQSARQCELTALNEILVGKPGARVGQIIGGTAHCKMLVRVANLGNSSGVKTLVVIGLDPYLDDSIEEKGKVLKRKNEEMDQVMKLMAYLKANPQKAAGGLGLKVENSRQQLINDIGTLQAELALLAEQLGLDENARVEVSKALYFGTEVKMGKLSWSASDDMSGTIVGLKDGEIKSGLPPPAKPKVEEQVKPVARKQWG